MDRFYSNESQIRWACLQLLAGNVISHMDEIIAVRGWRLSAIIHTLRTRYHWNIITEFRGKNRIGFYRLGDCNPEVLELPKSVRQKSPEVLTTPSD